MGPGSISFRKFFTLSACVGMGFSLYSHADADLGTGPKDFPDLVSQLGGSIPFPPENFVHALLNLDPHSSIGATIIPHGRSLVKDLTDADHPRDVLNWKTGSSTTPFNLYFGYAQNPEQIEVISFNQNTHQYDFFQVTQYAPGLSPQIINTPRGLCMDCHQHGGPIFSLGSWSETINNPEINRTESKDTNLEPFARFLYNVGLPPASFSSRIQLSSPEMDTRVHDGSDLLQFQNICAQGCGSNLECRKLQLKLSIAATLGQPDQGLSDLEMARFMELKKQTWPENNFQFRADFIQDRTPVGPLYGVSADEEPAQLRVLIDPVLPDDTTDVRFHSIPDRYRSCINVSNAVKKTLSSVSLSELLSRYDLGATHDWLAAHPWPSGTDLTQLLGL